MDKPQRVLHVSCDIPDPVDPTKARAVGILLDLIENEFDNDVISLNRITPSPRAFGREILRAPHRPHLRIETQQFDRGEAISYYAPPRGILHATMLHQLGEWLVRRVEAGPRPSLIVAHKLSIEGLVVRKVAERFGIPYCHSIQGDSDLKILNWRRDLSDQFAKIYHRADVVFPFTPWAQQQVEERLGKREGPSILLPCAMDEDKKLPPSAGGNGLLSVFHLRNHRRKNLRGMADALKLLNRDRKGEAVRLDVAGGGSDEELAICEQIARRSGTIRLLGARDREGVRQLMNGASAFVLPSLRESFGLVFVESLFAGLPVIYPAGTSIDGYFDDAPFALRVDARSPRSIAEAMRHALENEAEMKASLAEWQRSDHAKRFTRQRIKDDFASGLRLAMGQTG